MNRIILTIITLALTINLAKANDIDNLKTKDDVQKFLVEKVDTAWSKHNFFETIDKNETTIFGKGHFLKIDLDNNGLSDLLINGTYLFAVTDNGNGRYSKHFIDRGAFMLENHKLKGIIYKNKTPLIVIDKRKDNITIIEDDKQKEDSILKVMNARVDTLIFTFGDFYEYNPVPDNFKIEEIRISTSGCYGTCPIFEMKIDAKKNATYIAKEYNDEKGKFTGRIDDISFDRIIKTIN